MYRSHTCGELNINDIGKKVKLAGWVQRSRGLGGMTFIDLRDRYGITRTSFLILKRIKNYVIWPGLWGGNM